MNDSKLWAMLGLGKTYIYIVMIFAVSPNTACCGVPQTKVAGPNHVVAGGSHR